MDQAWILSMLLIMALGLVIMSSGFSRRGFSLSSNYKSLTVLFLSLILHIVVFPFLSAILGSSFSGHWMEAQSSLFLSIAALILIGSGIERLNCRAALLGIFIWQIFIYFPFLQITRPDGFLIQQWGLKDFAGGLLVHTTTGASALGLAMAKGRRFAFFNLKKSSNLELFSLGAGLVFLGWLGFNAAGADSPFEQTQAILNTLLAGAMGFLTWSGLDRWHPPQRVSIKGGVFGMISGLVVITPGAGWLSVNMALFAVFVGTVMAFYCALFVEKALRIDDEMKVFSSHFITSWVGAICVGIHFSDFQIQTEILLPLLTGLTCWAATFFIFKGWSMVTPIVLTERQEIESPDILIHGESSIEI